MDSLLFLLAPAASIVALLFAWFFYKQMMKESEGTETMRKIAAYVRRGAMSYLKQQYKVVGIVFLVLAAIFAVMAYGFSLQNAWVPVAFLTGGFFSGLSGYLGMKTATYASARTANAARQSLNGGLRIAFRSGAVMGLVVVGVLHPGRCLESGAEIMCDYYHDVDVRYGGIHTSVVRPCGRWNLYKSCRCGS